jgi:hypothetical protein
MTHIETGIKFVVTDNRCDVNLNLLTSSTQARKGLLPAKMEVAKLSTKALQPEADCDKLEHIETASQAKLNPDLGTEQVWPEYWTGRF